MFPRLFTGLFEDYNADTCIIYILYEISVLKTVADMLKFVSFTIKDS